MVSSIRGLATGHSALATGGTHRGPTSVGWFMRGGFGGTALPVEGGPVTGIGGRVVASSHTMRTGGLKPQNPGLRHPQPAMCAVGLAVGLLLDGPARRPEVLSQRVGRILVMDVEILPESKLIPKG